MEEEMITKGYLQAMIDDLGRDGDLRDNVMLQFGGGEYMNIDDVLRNGSAERFDLYSDDLKTKFANAFSIAERPARQYGRR